MLKKKLSKKQSKGRVSQPLKWHGGKFYLAKKIIALMPPHQAYLEPYAGGMSVLLQKNPEGVAEHVNDLNGMLINFWRVLQSPKHFEQFARMCALTPLSYELFHQAKIEMYSPLYTPRLDVQQAWLFFIKVRQSRQALGKDYVTPTTRLRRNMHEHVSAWLSAVDGLVEAHNRLQRVEIHRQHAVELIKKLDNKNLLVYADPPYLHETRVTSDEYGEHEMSPEDHKELLEALAGLKGQFILSGYPSKLYEKYTKKYKWTTRDISIPNNASSKKEKEIKIERLWMNFDPDD